MTNPIAKPTVSHKWKYPPLPALPLKTKDCIVVVSTGNRGKLLYNSYGFTIQKYAANLGVDFIHVEGDCSNPKFPYFDKLAVHEALNHYERVLYIDADVRMDTNAPNLFEEVPKGLLGIFDERYYYANDNIEKGIQRIVDIGDEYEFKFYRPFRYPSAGITLSEKQHQCLFELPSIPFIAHHTYEQDLLSARLFHHKFKTYWMGPDIQYVNGFGNHSKEGVYIHHCTGEV